MGQLGMDTSNNEHNAQKEDSENNKTPDRNKEQQ